MTRPLHVFLCHASQDKPAVRKLHRYLKQHGIEPWLDEIDLLPGENWEVEIPRALNASDVILVCLSKNSINKEGYVQKEISFALDKALEKPDGTIFIIPAKLEDCEVPNRLNRYQWVDLFRPDSNKRLLLGLNKRALSLGSDVSPVTVDDTRQKKSSITKPVVNSDQLNRDVVEKASREKMDREEAEKTAQTKLEQAEVARLAQEAKERSDREGAEKATIEKLELDAEELDHKYLAGKKLRSKTNLRFLGLGGIILFALGFGGFGLNYLIKNLPVATATIPFPTYTPTFETSTFTSVPITSNPQLTKTPIPTPTIGIGSTIIGKDGMTLLYIPEGGFTMGSNSPEGLPIHQVNLDAFWIDQTEVTNAMYVACVQEGSCGSPKNTDHFSKSEYANHPVVYVSWNDANTYCSWVDRRLPTEAEWEKTARGPDALEFPWGNEAPNIFLLNYDNNVRDTTEVGSYPTGKSVYGALDMAGNVWEWVNDWYSETYYNNSPSSNPLGPDLGQYRVTRGGSWNNYNGYTRSARRNNNYEPSSSYNNLGFRCARSP